MKDHASLTLQLISSYFGCVGSQGTWELYSRVDSLIVKKANHIGRLQMTFPNTLQTSKATSQVVNGIEPWRTMAAESESDDLKSWLSTFEGQLDSKTFSCI